jgi:predicted RNase H-like nuclease (RuvC/YqgF family)
MKDMQTEILTSKSLQATTAPKQSNPTSRLEIRQREKEETAQSSRNAVVIRDLEGKLEQRSKEIEELSLEVSRLKSENSSLG